MTDSDFLVSTTTTSISPLNASIDLFNETTSIKQVASYTPVQSALIGISAGLLSVVTTAGNLMVMISFKMDKQLQTISNYFLFSLAVADIIIGTISMPLFTVFIIQRQWTLGTTVCDAWLSVDYLASNASVLNLLVISFDRYFSVTRPLTYRARRTTRKAALMIFSAWAISAVVWPPWIIAWPYIEGERTVPNNECYIQFIYSNEYMSIVTVMIAFFVPVTIMIGLYVRVWWETVKRQKELVHLQAGKRVSSKRSDSSDETVDEHGTLTRGGSTSFAGAFRGGWRNNLAQSGANKSKDGQQDLSYMPSAMFKSRSSALSLTTDQRSTDDNGSSFCNFLATPLYLCCAGIGNTSGIEEASSEGYATPRSLETPVQTASKCPSLNHIRDPYASRHPSMLRHSASIEEKMPRNHQQQQIMKRANSTQQKASTSCHNANTTVNDPLDLDTDSIYTILIRFPPKGSDKSSSGTNSNNNNCSVTCSDSKRTARRVPSIQMLPDEASCKDFEDFERTNSLGSTTKGYYQYPKSVSNVRSIPSVKNKRELRICKSSNPSATSSPSRSQKSSHQSQQKATTNKEDIAKLPLDAKLVPKQFVRAQTTCGAISSSQGAITQSQNASMMSVTSSGFKRPLVSTMGGASSKPKKASSEKKQDRKAAKTLSAILLAFIITWTPYSVLVVINAILGKEAADSYIPAVLWEFSYYLCYINSTVNPVLYALCNAAFRRTYVRILTCRWGSRSRQPVNRYYYG